MGAAAPGADIAAEWERLIHPDDWDANLAHRERLRRGEPSEVRYRLCGYDGVVRWIEAQARSVQRAGACSSRDRRDVTRQVEAEQALASAREEVDRLAAVNGQTRCRRADRAGQPTQAACSGRPTRLRPGGPWLMALFDLDGFKRYNDTLAIRPATSCWCGSPRGSPRRCRKARRSGSGATSSWCWRPRTAMSRRCSPRAARRSRRAATASRHRLLRCRLPARGDGGRRRRARPLRPAPVQREEPAHDRRGRPQDVLLEALGAAGAEPGAARGGRREACARRGDPLVPRSRGARPPQAGRAPPRHRQDRDPRLGAREAGTTHRPTSGSSSVATRSSASGSSTRHRPSATLRRSSVPRTRMSTAPAIRTVCAATRSRWRPGSSRPATRTRR